MRKKDLAIVLAIFLTAGISSEEAAAYTPPAYTSINEALLTAECKSGSATVCALEGSRAFRAKGFAVAAAHLHKACSLGATQQCLNAGLIYKSGLIASPSNLVIVDLFTRACEGKEKFGCADLGLLYQEGKLVFRSYEMAQAYFKTSCDAGYKDGCDNSRKLAEALGADKRVMRPWQATTPSSEREEPRNPTAATGPVRPSQPNDEVTEACRSMKNAAEGILRTKGRAAIEEMLAAKPAVIAECTRRNIVVRPAVLDQPNTTPDAKTASQLATCKKLMTNYGILFDSGPQEYFENEAEWEKGAEVCKKLGVYERPPSLYRFLKLCQDRNAARTKIRDLEAKLKHDPRYTKPLEPTPAWFRNACRAGKVPIVVD